MIEPIKKANIKKIKNPEFRAYAQTYIDIEKDFLDQISSYGLDVSSKDFDGIDSFLAGSLADRGVSFSNECKSLHTGWISPACIACRKGIKTATFLISVQCPKNCYFCFNVNQADYEYFLTHTRDVAGELEKCHERGILFDDLALTGGEPLMHKEETLSFFQKTAEFYPETYTRLYTSGVGLDDVYMRKLADAHLDEIRFSIKTDEQEEEQQRTLEKIKRSKEFIPHVMVEMPVMPGEFDSMKRLLTELDEIGIEGINLLEFCFPLNNGEEFAQRGFSIKKEPFSVLYDYWYAGGLPIAGSEQVCLQLLEFALDTGLEMGVHYCTLENKFTGQIFLQNNPYRNDFPVCIMSERDHFFKSSKVFGEDIASIKAFFKKNGLTDYREDSQDGYLEFHPHYLDALKDHFGNTEVGISYYIVEQYDRGPALRELRIDKTSPTCFEISLDI